MPSTVRLALRAIEEVWSGHSKVPSAEADIVENEAGCINQLIDSVRIKSSEKNTMTYSNVKMNNKGCHKSVSCRVYLLRILNV